MLVLEGLADLHKTIQFSFLGVTGRDRDLDYCDIEWFALEMNRDHSVIFEIASKYCILDSFNDYDGYSLSSMGLYLRCYILRFKESDAVCQRRESSKRA